MRALVRDAARITTPLYRRFWRRAQLDAMIPDLMVRGEPYLALNALVLSAADRRCLERLTRVFSRVFQAAGQQLAGDVDATIGLGFPWAAAELLAREPRRLPLIGRFDFVQDETGRWHLLELNADTPSGVREGVACDRLVWELLPEAQSLSRPSQHLARRLADAIAGAVDWGAMNCAPTRFDPVGAQFIAPSGGGASPFNTLGIVTTASELEDLSQMAFTANLLRPALAARGWDVVLGDAGNLRQTRRGLTLRGSRIDALYRYLPFEAIFGTPTFVAMEEAATLGGVEILNGLYGLLLQNKGLIAWIWAHRNEPSLFDAEARSAIAEHLPATWRIEEAPPDARREHLVAKQVFGREGQEVFFGEDCSPELWSTLAQRQTYVAQARVRVAEVRAVVQTSLGPVIRDGYPTVGCFAVNGDMAGCYTRFGDKITTSRSKWLATFSEPSEAEKSDA
ncbi:MAG: glutathionylspermidine synthase family protein [Chloroflexota bacterium]